jgi:hypothetical protein
MRRSMHGASWPRVPTALRLLLALLVLGFVVALSACGQQTAASGQQTHAPGDSSERSTYASTLPPQPTPPCPAPPSPSTGAQLYWTPSPSQGEHPSLRPQALCGVGFQSGEQITLTVESRSGAPTAAPSLRVISDSNGSFAAGYVPTSGCGSTEDQLVVHAQGNKGSASSISVPSSLLSACPPPT